MHISISNLALAVGYPEKVADEAIIFTFRVDGGEIVAQSLSSRLILKRYLEVPYDKLQVFASYAAGRMLREEAVLSWDDRSERAFLWREIPKNADASEMKAAFEEFADSCDWWVQRTAEIDAPESVFPDIMIRP
jgi:hypothetical protein